MKNIHLLSAGFILLLSLTYCSPQEFPLGNFQKTPILADGNAEDWGLPLRFGSDGGALQYNITNDSRNIYVSVATNDQATQISILRAGISIYVDTKGKKNKTMGLSFPANEALEGEHNRSVSPANYKKQNLMDKDIFKTFGFINMENTNYAISDTSAIKMGINYDAFGNLIFESIIPLKYIFNKSLNAKTAPSISIGIVLNPLTMRSGNRGPNSAGGETGMRSGGGGMGGGMRGGGMSGGGMGGGGMNGGGMGGGMRGGGGGMGGGRRGGGGMRGGGMRGGGGSFTPQNLANWYQFKLAF